MSQLQDRWIKGERYAELAQILDLPVMREALAIVEELAKPSHHMLTNAVAAVNAPEAGMRLAGIAFSKAGIQEAVDKIRALAKPYVPPKPPETKQPYDDITEKNYEKILNSDYGPNT